MTAVLDAPASARRGGTSTAPSGRDLLHRYRGPVALMAVLVVAGAAFGVLRATDSGDLDPRSYSTGGARAVAELLQDQGIAVRVVEDLPALERETGPRSTVLLPQPLALTGDELDAVAGLVQDEQAALVVGNADPSSLDLLGVPASAQDEAGVSTRQPACSAPVATRAGSARTGGASYAADRSTDAVGCYAVDGAATVLLLPGARVTVLGSLELLTNERLDEDGNAALALGLLGGAPDGQPVDEVLWLLPRPDRELPGAPSTLRELVPEALVWGLVQVAVAVVLLALWRARRLGRVVVEPLPVVVRAAETVEGRGRLYRAAAARDQASEGLRAGARDRLARRLGLPPDAGRAGLVASLAGRTGQDPLRVDELLYGPPPPDDGALVRLADELDGLDP